MPKKFTAILFGMLTLFGLYLSSRLYNYLLFHSFADMVAIVIAACVFMIVWNARRLIDNNYFLYTGIAFLFFAFLDFMHLLGNKNMGVFPEYGNLGPTFYSIWQPERDHGAPSHAREPLALDAGDQN